MISSTFLTIYPLVRKGIHYEAFREAKSLIACVAANLESSGEPVNI